MPCPHYDISIISRRQSAVAAAAYQSGDSLFSEYDSKRKSYKEKQGIIYTEIMLPSHAPPEFMNRETLWNSAEKNEKQWNSQLARRIVLALPKELDREAQIEMLQRYCREQFVSRGMCVDFALHDKAPQEAVEGLTQAPHDAAHQSQARVTGNPHAHIMLAMRALDEQRHWLPKSRKVYDLDENGERIRLPSGEWKSHKENTVDWNEQTNAGSIEFQPKTPHDAATNKAETKRTSFGGTVGKLSRMNFLNVQADRSASIYVPLNGKA